MSYIKVGNEKLGSVALPSNAHGYSGSMSVKTTNQHPLSTRRQRKFTLALVALLAAAFGCNSGPRAQDVATPIPGVLGQVQSVGDHSITIQNKSGLFHIDIAQPLTTYHTVPSDLSSNGHELPYGHRVVAAPILGDLHHEYRLETAA